MSTHLEARTIAGLGDRPAEHGGNPGSCVDAETKADVIGRLSPFSDVRGAKCADIDSASRRIVRMPACAGVAEVRTHHWRVCNCTVSAIRPEVAS